MKIHARLPVVPQRAAGHDDAQVRAADADVDVDDVGKLSSRYATNFPAVDSADESGHFLERQCDLVDPWDIRRDVVGGLGA